jgi:hypothetical protein
MKFGPRIYRDLGADDLGFNVGPTTNLFELFAKEQKGDTVETIDVPPADKDKPPSSTPATDTTGKDKTDQGEPKPDPAKEEEERKNAEALKNLLLNPTKGADTTEGGSKDKTDPKKDGDQGGKTETDPPAETAVGLVFLDLKEKGIIDVGEDFQFDGTEDGLRDAIEQTVQSRLTDAIDEEVETVFTKNPKNKDIAKDFFRFLATGGDFDEFYNTRQSAAIDIKALDSEDETLRKTVADKVLINYHKSLGWPDDRIKRYVERLTPEARVESARDIYPEWDKANKDKAKIAEDKRKQDAVDAQTRVKTFNETVSKTITESKELFGQEMTPKLRQQLNDYMFKPTVEVNGKKIPQFLAERQKQQNTPEFLLMQAMSLMTGKKLVADPKKVETQVTNSLEERLKGLQQGRKSTTATGQGTDSKKDNNNRSSLFDFSEEDSIISL